MENRTTPRSSSSSSTSLRCRSRVARTISSGTAGTYALPTQTTITATPALTYALARRSNLRAIVSIIDTDSQGTSLAPGQTGELNVLSIQPQVGIGQELTSQHLALRRTDAANLAWYPVPLLQIDLNSVLQRTRMAVVRSSIGVGTSSFVDPVLGVAVSRGLAQASVDAQLGPWSVGVRCAFATDLSGSQQANASGGVSADETFVMLEIPVRYRSSRNLIAEFGGRFSERGPKWSTSTIALHSETRELWLYVNLTTFSRPSSTRS